MNVRVRVLWELYRPVRLLLAAYVFVVACGTLIEGLALAAIVPLVDGGESGVTGFYADLMELLGLNPDSAGQLVALVGGLFVLRAFAQYGSNVLAGVMTRRQTVSLQVELFRLYINLQWETALEITQGEANLLLGAQTQQVAQFLKKCVTLLEGGVYTVGLTVVAIVVSPQNTLIAVTLIGASGVAVAVISTKIRRYAETILEKTKAQAGALLQYARGAQMLRAFDVAEYAVLDIEEQAKTREYLEYRRQRVEAVAKVLPDLLFVLALLTVVGLAVRSGGGIAEVGAVVALLFRVSQYLKRFADFAALSGLVPAVKDVHRRRTQFRRRQVGDLAALYEPGLPPGAIDLEDVTYQYRTAVSPAVVSVSNSVRPGEFIGIVGSSGSGKSTLLSMIVGLLEPQRGAVRMGGSGEVHALRPVAFVSQTPFLLRGTIASNVRWFRDISDDDVARACEVAGLRPLLERLPLGLETPTGQEGLSLSGGERQRLALARALAGRPQVVVLDEATSALDSESERSIQQALDEMHGSVTVIAVAHRLSTVLSADRIWVMENGRIIEDAPPTELLARTESRFAKLSAMQGIELS